MGIHANPYFQYLAQEMRTREHHTAPKRQTDYQFYMRHLDFKDQVAERFEADHAHEPRKQHLSLRCQLAREMLAEEPEEVRERVHKECDEAHAREMKEYEEEDEGLPSPDPEVQQE